MQLTILTIINLLGRREDKLGLLFVRLRLFFIGLASIIIISFISMCSLALSFFFYVFLRLSNKLLTKELGYDSNGQYIKSP